MRRRPSDSTTDEADATSSPEPAPAPGHGDVRENAVDKAGKLQPGRGDVKERRRSHESATRAVAEKSHAWKTTSPVPGEKENLALNDLTEEAEPEKMAESSKRRRWRLRNPWSISLLTLATIAASILVLVVISKSFLTRQQDPKGCAMSYMRPSFVRFSEFDTEHTRFASKYSLYMYREGEIDEDARVKGVPVLFIPGNAGSYKQVRPFAAEAAYHYHNVLRHDDSALRGGKRPLDFFTVDFNEDITAFHGQTLLDQAEYLNDAILYILSLYHNPNRSIRDPQLPDPSSVIMLGHSMGGIVARTMLMMPNYQSNSINTIITLSAPHARAPVSFDAEIVRTYKRMNDYWRQAYSQKWAIDNPLWHVTLISIAGGGLDTMIPSEYASLSSIVPPTHGFTVFTSTIPNVWTGMDHLAITWCDQFRKSVVRAIYDVIDVRRSTQTTTRAERMRYFKKWFLTGMEDVAERTLPHKEPRTLLTLEDNANSIVATGERLVLRSLGEARKPRAYLLPVPPQGAPEGRKFTFMTDRKMEVTEENNSIEVLFCSVFPLQSGQSAALFSMNMDLSGDSSGSTRLACKNANSDVISLPASTRESQYPFDQISPFSYLQYDLGDLAEHQFVAVVDKAHEPTQGWAVAEFSASSESIVRSNVGLRRLLLNGLTLKLPAGSPMMLEVKIPALHSSLLAYHLSISKQDCGNSQLPELFRPLLRQYVTEVYESKFFVNVEEADVSLHGIAPFMPPAFRKHGKGEGMSLQIWSDPTCQGSAQLTLTVDLFGSMGKLWMRYRAVFAAFPLIVVALILRKQFKVYDETGVFMSFAESANQCLRTSLPVLFMSLTFLSMSLARATEHQASDARRWVSDWPGNATESFVDYTKNDLLLGSQDPFFWFLIPLFGTVCIGITVLVNYATLAMTHVFAMAYSWIRPLVVRSEDAKRTTPTTFAVTSTRQRILTTGILLAFVSTVIPYHFAYMVLCIVQIATSVRACRFARDTKTDANYNFYNYVHSVLILMIWVLPINLPVLVVWIRNLAVHWLTPFSSHHNILSIFPFILLVETLSTGRMVPRVTSRTRYFTNVFFFVLAVFAGIYGVSYAYILHHLANILCAWLVIIHLSTTSFSLSRLNGVGILENGVQETQGRTKKRP